MTVNQLETTLRQLAVLMEAVEGKQQGVRDVRDLADRLAPFARLSLREFADFLVKAEAYSRGDLESVFGKPKPARSGRPAKAPANPDRIPEAIARLKSQYDRALDSGVTTDTVNDAVDPLSSFTKPELEQVALGCGFQQKFKKKDDILTALKKWILQRKGSFDRASI
jgi:hypothetical protein